MTPDPVTSGQAEFIVVLLVVCAALVVLGLIAATIRAWLASLRRARHTITDIRADVARPHLDPKDPR
jgi:hypothetical protein